jgi:hypothetical protein
MKVLNNIPFNVFGLKEIFTNPLDRDGAVNSRLMVFREVVYVAT